MSRPNLLIPLFVYPTTGAWLSIVQAAQAFPSVKIIAIVNPGNGPETTGTADPNYTLGIQQLNNAGVTCIGYIYSNYGAVTTEALQTEMQLWIKLHPEIKGFFLDEVQSTGGENYLATVMNVAHQLNRPFVIGNPGTPIPDTYLSLLNAFVIYEGVEQTGHTFPFFQSGSKGPLPFLPPSSNFGAIEYGVASAFVNSSLGYIFQTSNPGTPGNEPYDTMSPILWQLMQALAATPA